MTTLKDATLVRMGEMALARGQGTLVALGLGSCVAVILHDPAARVGCLAHVLLPNQSLSRDRSNAARTADTAIPLAADRMRAEGAERSRIVGRLVGGASMFAELLVAGTIHIGERNITACRTGLRDLGIPIAAEAVGGQTGRSVWFDVARGTVRVRTAGHEPEDL